MKNYLSSFALLLFALLLAIMQINAAAISVAEADDYHSSGSTAANSLVARNAPEALDASVSKDEIVSPSHRDPDYWHDHYRHHCHHHWCHHRW